MPLWWTSNAREAEARRAARFKRWMVGTLVLGSMAVYAYLGAKAFWPLPGGGSEKNRRWPW